MPTYKVLSEEEINKWKQHLITILNDVLTAPSISNVSYFIIETFEYAQVSTFYEKNKGKCNGVFKDVKITIKELKGISSNEDEFFLINKFKKTADNLRHNGYDRKILIDFIDTLISKRDVFERVFSSIFSDIPCITRFFCGDGIRNVFKELFKPAEMKKICRRFIFTFCNEKNVVMKNLVHFLQGVTGLSESFVSSVILEVLNDADVTIEYY